MEEDDPPDAVEVELCPNVIEDEVKIGVFDVVEEIVEDELPGRGEIKSGDVATANVTTPITASMMMSEIFCPRFTLVSFADYYRQSGVYVANDNLVRYNLL